MNHKKTRCVHGHDLTLPGARLNSGGCRECKRSSMRGGATVPPQLKARRPYVPDPSDPGVATFRDEAALRGIKLGEYGERVQESA